VNAQADARGKARIFFLPHWPIAMPWNVVVSTTRAHTPNIPVASKRICARLQLPIGQWTYLQFWNKLNTPMKVRIKPNTLGINHDQITHPGRPERSLHCPPSAAPASPSGG
jgi:hypothetical protein